MNFFTYIGISEDEFVEKYLNGGLVTQAEHKEFPLLLFTYSRKAVHDNVWDGVTSKCRGIIINRETDEIVARPFEKFHNYGSTQATEDETSLHVPDVPYVIEKVDGFLCTLYTWGGKSYIASKGSFHSTHAKWATVEYDKKCPMIAWPFGYTPVFEGLCRDLRIVVDYGDRSGLVLLALINNETGEEMVPTRLAEEAALRGFETAKVFDKTLLDALEDTIVTGSADKEEGYVLTWYRSGQTPYRLKVKFVEYLRLHRMVTGVSPKHIWEVLSQAHLKPELDEYLSNSTPWFSQFVAKWTRVLRAEYDRQMTESTQRYMDIVREMKPRHFSGEFAESPHAFRKAYAMEFQKPENIEFAPILFAMLDGKDISVVIWKRVRALTENGHPMVDIHAL